MSGAHDGLFSVTSPTGAARARPQSAGTRLRQKPPAPSHQDLFATLGIDPAAGGASARSSFFSNRGSSASVSSMSGLSNASLHQFGAPPTGTSARGTFGTQLPPPTPALANTTNWSGSGSRFAPAARAPPPPTAARFEPSNSAPTTFGAHGGMFATTAPPPPQQPPPAPATKTSNASLFSMEDADAFAMDDGWGCDSPSAVLSPVSAPSQPADAAAGVAAHAVNDNDFGWADEETDRQFGITPPKPVSPATMPTAAPPLAAPQAPTLSPSPAAHSVQATTYPSFRQESSTTETSSVTFPSSSTVTPPAAAAPASELAYVERNSWGESWDDTEAFPDQKSSPIAATPAASGTSGGDATTTSIASPLNVPVPESMPVENEFWGDQDDDALFDDDEHANDKWDETPVTQSTADAIARMSLEDKEAASTGDVPSHYHHQAPPASGATVAFSGHVEYAPEPSSMPHLSDDKHMKEEISESGEGGHFASSPVEKDPHAGSLFASDSPTVPPPQESESASSPAHGGAFGYHDHQQYTRGDEVEDAVAQKSWEGEQQHAAPEPHEAHGAHWSSGVASPSKDSQLGNNFYPHGEVVASVQFEPAALESDGSSHFGGHDEHSRAFEYGDNSSREEAQFYASVRNHEDSSTASIGGDVSSAGATFGGSDYVRSDTFSDGTFSETRSIIGSSNASTAFGTDFPSVSEGFSAAATTFGGSDYVSDGQFSDGNVSESPSLNESLHPSAETNPELPRTGEEQFFGEDQDDDETNPFEMSENSASTFDEGYPPTPSAGLFDHVSGGDSEKANPFASSSASFAPSSDEATPFGAPPAASSANEAEPTAVQSAASLFGATAGSDVSNPFGEQPADTFASKELQVADASDLFASSPTAAAFGGSSFNEPSQRYNDQGYQSNAQGYHHQHNQDFGQSPFEQARGGYSASSHFGHASVAGSADELFSQSQGSYDGFSADSGHFGQQSSDSTANEYSGYPQQSGSVYGNVAGDHFAHSGQHTNESYYANHEGGGADAALAEQSSSKNYFHDHSHAAIPPSPAPSVASMFGSSSVSQSSLQSDNRSEIQGGGRSFVPPSAAVGSDFSHPSYAHTETTTSSAGSPFGESSREQAHTMFGHSQQQHQRQQEHQSSAKHQFRQSDSFLSSGFNDSFGLQSSASAQDFFGDASDASSSFASSNEFFGDVSSSVDGSSHHHQQEQYQQELEQSQPSLSLRASEAPAYSDHHFAYETPASYEQQPHEQQPHEQQPHEQQPHEQQPHEQSWSQGDSFAGPPHESFDAPAYDGASEFPSEHHSHSSASEFAQRSEQTSTLPPKGTTPFGHGDTSEHSGAVSEHSVPASDNSQYQYDSPFQQDNHNFGKSTGMFGASEAADANTFESFPQHEGDSSSFFGSASQSGNGFETAGGFTGEMSSNADLFSGPPPGQDATASSYFDGQANTAQAHGGFEQSAIRELNAAPSTPQQASSVPAQLGVGYGAARSQMQSFEQAQRDGYDQFATASHQEAESSLHHHQPYHHQQQQVFGQTDRGYGETAASSHQVSLESPNVSSFAAHRAPAGRAPQTSQHYGHAPTGGASSYGPEYSASTQGHSVAGYGGVHTQSPSAQRSSKYKDPCVPAPSCLASFGFGGNVVTMFPKRKLRLNMAGGSFRNSPRAQVPPYPDNSELGELRKGPVSMYRMEQIHPRDRHFEQLESFPGPLTENVSEDVVLHYLDDHLKETGAMSNLQEDERLLSGILKILVKCNGKLRSDPTGNPSDPNSPEVQLVTLLRESDYRRRGNQPPVFPSPKVVQTGLNPDAMAKNASTIRDLLLVGDRNAAVDVAVHAHMWPEAMLIASFTGKDEYKRVLRAYLEEHYAIGDPARALYMSFADQQEKSVQEPQKLMQPHHQQPAEQSSAILASWVTHAQVILANRTGDTNKILVELGDRLWKETGSILAAHACYLLAGIPVDAPSPSSKIALLGADHRTPKEARFYVSSSAVQRTEIYEWIQKRSSGGAVAHMIPFQGYKLIYAMILADHGKLETSFKYVNAMLLVIKAVTATMKPGTSLYLEGMQNQLTVLDDRLRQHLGQHRVNSVASASSSKQGKWGLGSALSIMGKIVNRVVEGNEAPGAPLTAHAGGQSDAGSSLFPGAPRVPPSPAYSSGPTQAQPSYVQQQQQQQQFGQPAPLSNDSRSATPQRSSGYDQQPPQVVPPSNLYGAPPLSNDSSAQKFHRAATPTPTYPSYGQQQLQSAPRSNDSSTQQQHFHRVPTPTPAFPGFNQPSAPYGNESSAFTSTPPQQYAGYGQHVAQATPRSNELNQAVPAYPSTPSQSFQGYGQHGAQHADTYNTAPRSNNGSSTPGFHGYGQPAAPHSNEAGGAPSYPNQQQYPAYGQQQPPPRSNDSSAAPGYQRDHSQAHYGYGQYGNQTQAHPGYRQHGIASAPRSNDSNASRGGYQREQSHAYTPGYSQQGGITPANDGFGTPKFDPSATHPQGGSVATPSGAFVGPESSPQMQYGEAPGNSQSTYMSPQPRSTTAPPPLSLGSASNGPPSSQGGGFPPPHHALQAAKAEHHFANQPHLSNSAPPSVPASPSTFKKPTLDLSGDAGKGVTVPGPRASDKPRSPTAAAAGAMPTDNRSAVASSSGPSSDKGSASPKVKDTKGKGGGRSKTPPPSGSKSFGWFPNVISNLIARRMHPDAKVVEFGEEKQAYYDEETKRWVFPGEESAEEQAIPSAPPTGPIPGISSGGPPGTHSAPGSIGGGPTDSLSALMAPPPARNLMKKDPLSAMMAPPTRSMPGMRGASTGAQRKPPRPQFAVFKPAPQAPQAPEAAEE